jgi:hypothetical protein
MITTLVSCFYEIKNNRKRSLEEYKHWYTSFLVHRTQPLVLFLEPSLLSKEIELLCKENGHPFRIVYRFFEDLAYGTPEWLRYWNFAQRNDISSSIVCPEMYRIWANKYSLLEEVVRENPFQTSQFVWSDIGCWRGSPSFQKKYLHAWPSRSIERFEVLWISNLESYRTLYRTRKPATLEEWICREEREEHSVNVAGAQFGGSTEHCLALCTKMKEGFELYRKNSIQADTDQTVLADVALWMEENNESVHNILASSIPIQGYDAWFAFQVLWS